MSEHLVLVFVFAPPLNNAKLRLSPSFMFFQYPYFSNFGMHVMTVFLLFVYVILLFSKHLSSHSGL